MKKLVPILLGCFLLSISLFALTACNGGDENSNNPPHTHDYSIAKFDDKSHWFECECGKKSSVAFHNLINNACICGYQVTETHTHDYKTLKFDSISHWYECECGDKSNLENHKGGTATETSKPICSVCNQSYGTLIGHTHNYQATKTPPKCGEKGYTTYSCECGDSYISDYVSALTHVYTNYSYNNDAKCEVDGTKTASCDNGCGTKNTINATGTALRHSFTRYYSDKNATYEKDGTKTANCDNGCGEKDTIADVGSMLVENEIRFNTLSVDGTDVYGKVSNKTETFSFIDEVLAVGTAKFVVSLDIYGIQPISTKTIPLTVGDNKVYVIEMIDGEPTDVYKVVVRRKPMYTVSFNSNGGTNVQSQTIEEDGVAIAPITTRTGYTFDKWDYNFNTPITSNKTITASWTANTNTAYKVEYYLENLENDNYSVLSTATENLMGTTNSTVYAEIKTFAHFTHKESSTDSGNINANGTTVLKVYYTRDKYTVTFNGNGGTLVSGNASQTVKYGGSVTAPIYTKTGYTFNGYDKTNYTNISESFIVTAKWQINQYTVTLVYGNGQTDKQITQDYNSALGDVAQPEKNGYTFDGWDKAIPTKMPAQNTTINAKWLAIFEVSNGSITGLTSHGKTFTKIVIPETIDGVKITSIGSSAFYNCSSLTNVTIGDSVTSIGSSAFEGCKSLTSVVIPNSVTSIGERAFWHCESLTSIEIPDSVTSIGDYAFYYCTSLTSIEIPNSVTSIGDGAFSGCDSLTNIEIPDSVTSVGDYAFYSCESLTSIEIPASVTSIGSSVFYGCDSLRYNEKDGLKYLGNSNNKYLYLAGAVSEEITTAIIDVNCKFIGSSAFENCDSLTSIVIPDSVTSIGSYAFSYCDSLTSIEISASVTSIGKYAFYDCSNLETVTFGENSQLEIIEFGAFENCRSLTSIEIPDSVTSIGGFAFFYCTSLTSIEIPASVTSIGFNAFCLCSSLESIEIPDSVTSIGVGAFSNCRSLTSIEIPDSVTSIGANAFEYCDKLTDIYCEAESQPSGWDSSWKDACNATVHWGAKIN